MYIKKTKTKGVADLQYSVTDWLHTDLDVDPL